MLNSNLTVSQMASVAESGKADPFLKEFAHKICNPIPALNKCGQMIQPQYTGYFNSICFSFGIQKWLYFGFLGHYEWLILSTEIIAADTAHSILVVFKNCTNKKREELNIFILRYIGM